MRSNIIAAAVLCAAILITSAVSLSTKSQAIEMAEFGLASCFEGTNPTALAASDTTLLAIATDPAFERKVCQIDTHIPIHSFAGHIKQPVNGSLRRVYHRDVIGSRDGDPTVCTYSGTSRTYRLVDFQRNNRPSGIKTVKARVSDNQP